MLHTTNKFSICTVCAVCIYKKSLQPLWYVNNDIATVNAAKL